MAQVTLSARRRTTKGKGAARKLRKEKQIPAIFYGPKSQPVMLTVDDAALKGVLKRSAGENVILGLQIESDKGTDTRTVMLKELQADPVRPVYLHADFYEISMDKELTLDIPVVLLNTPAGVAKGGILQQITRELNVSGLPSKLVEHIDVDVSGLDVGDAIHLSDIDLPDGVKANEEDHLTIAVVSAPTVVAEKAEEEEIIEEEEAAEAEAAGTVPEEES